MVPAAFLPQMVLGDGVKVSYFETEKCDDSSGDKENRSGGYLDEQVAGVDVVDFPVYSIIADEGVGYVATWRVRVYSFEGHDFISDVDFFFCEPVHRAGLDAFYF